MKAESCGGPVPTCSLFSSDEMVLADQRGSHDVVQNRETYYVSSALLYCIDFIISNTFFKVSVKCCCRIPPELPYEMCKLRSSKIAKFLTPAVSTNQVLELRTSDSFKEQHSGMKQLITREVLFVYLWIFAYFSKDIQQYHKC